MSDWIKDDRFNHDGSDRNIMNEGVGAPLFESR